MKKIVIALVAILTLASCTQPKVGVVNTEKLIKEYKETVNAEAEIKEKSEKTQKNLEHLYQAFQAKVTDYQKNAAKMSSKVRAQKEQELGAEQQMIQQKQQQAQYQVQNDGQAAIKKIAEKVNTYIKDYKVDLTDVVLKALNDKYTSGSSTTEEETPAKTEETKKEEIKK